jgi:quercetin dioxygenase-like cupin family protein
MFKISQKRPASQLISFLLLSIAVAVACLWSAHFSAAQSGARASHPDAFSHALPQLDGNHLRATVLEVNYAPGEADKPHSHPCTVIGYVAQGAIRFQIRSGGPESVFKAGGKLLRAAERGARGIG